MALTIAEEKKQLRGSVRKTLATIPQEELTRSDDALFSAPVTGIPEDWGRVLLDWNNYEKDYKDPYNIDFKKLHDLYLQVEVGEWFDVGASK